jgi:hypothetical protein
MPFPEWPIVQRDANLNPGHDVKLLFTCKQKETKLFISERGRRAFFLDLFAALFDGIKNSPEERRRGEPLLQRHPHNFPPGLFDLFPPYYFVHLPVRTFDEDIGKKDRYDFPGSFFSKRHEIIDIFDGCQDLHPFFQRKYRPGKSFDHPDGSVVVNRDDQNIAQFFRLLEKMYMTCVEKIEAPVGEDDFSALLLQGCSYPFDFSQGLNFVSRCSQGLSGNFLFFPCPRVPHHG